MKAIIGMMQNFAWTVLILWLLGGIAGIIYSSQQNIPAWVSIAAIPAILVEIALYVAPGFVAIRQRFTVLGNAVLQGLILWTLAVIPYLIYASGTRSFSWKSFGLLLLISGCISLWYVVLPRSASADLGLLGVIAAVLLSDAFKVIYPQLAAKASVTILGQLMLIRTTAFSVLCIRKLENVGYGFLPTREDWIAGLRNFVYFMPAGFALALFIQFTEPKPGPVIWIKVVPIAIFTFLGMLWVVALSEEFFFRGILQPMLSRWLSSRWMGLILTSVLFGMVHLPFRSFPNWRFALVAGLAGFFYGRAFQETGSIRSGMVTHALVATTWRVFLV
jgi:membrane protease YdiL (CAAX protease family)